MRRLTYLVYYLKGLDREKFKKFFGYVVENYEFTKASLLKDILDSVFRYNISILDYFHFRFFEKDHIERLTYAGTGYMYEYQLRMNPKTTRSLLENKLEFLSHYKNFVGHRHFKISKLSLNEIQSKARDENLEKIVLKGSQGQCGEGVIVLDTKIVPTPDTEFNDLSEYDLMEEYIVQHVDLMRLSPAGLNTVRIFTQIDAQGEVHLLGSRLRVTVDSYVDNLAAGNLAAPVDDNSGMVTGPGVYSDITKSDESVHPITGIPIQGFKVPYWNETVARVKSAALYDTRNKSIGWDVAITDAGPFLLEANHNWCKLLWQLPVKKGLKNTLEAYIS